MHMHPCWNFNPKQFVLFFSLCNAKGVWITTQHWCDRCLMSCVFQHHGQRHLPTDTVKANILDSKAKIASTNIDSSLYHISLL